MATTPYQYQPLLSSDKKSGLDGDPQPDSKVASDNKLTCIRLLNLFPGTFESNIHVELETVTLDPTHPPQYEALSYVWGTSHSTETLYIKDQGTHIGIGKNLGTALRYLRHPTQSRTLWVDAVCINQADIVERGQQVKHMGDIYRLAKHVIAWLGEDANDSDRALDILNELGSKLEMEPITRALKPSATGQSEPYLAERSYQVPLDFNDLSALNHLFQRLWFDRLWIRQEVYLGYKSAIVQVGAKLVSWRNFALGAIRVMRNQLSKTDTALNEVLHTRLGRLQELFYHDLVMIESLRRLCGRCLCTDPRDRVYAVMNMIPDHQKVFIGDPNYTLPASEIWKDTVLSYIRHFQTVGPECVALLILDECVGEEPFDKPTWIPDWEVKDFNDPTRPYTFLGMSGSMITPHIELPGGDTLRVLGVRVQNVAEIIPIPDTKSFIPAVRKFLGGIDLTQAYPAGGIFMDACAMTLLGGQIQEYTSPPRDDKATMSEVRQDIEDILSLSLDGMNDSEPPSIAEFRLRVSDCLVGRCLITTTDGYIGVAPKTVKICDQIAVLAGGYSPVIIRESSKTPGGHHLIGSCFLQGFMWLEAFLGPLPEDHHYVAREYPGENYAVFEVVNEKTGEALGEDPRVASWPIVDDYRKAGEADDFYTIDILADVNKEMGVKAEFFDLV